MKRNKNGRRIAHLVKKQYTIIAKLTEKMLLSKRGEAGMAERQSKRRLYITWAAVIAAVVLLCALGSMRLISGWGVFGGAAAGAIIIAYSIRLRESERVREALARELDCEKERSRQLGGQIEQERETAARQVEAERAAAHRMLVEQKKANEERNANLLSRLAHGVRLPVSVAAGYADLLRDKAIDDADEAKEYLTKISDRLRYINEIISRNLAAVQDGEADLTASLQRMSFDLVDFINRDLEDCRSLAREKGIEIQFISPEPTISVSADPVLLQHVIDNLLENAMKYMGRSGTVTFVLTRDGTDVRLVCRDDGLGMESLQASHIFENGFRGSNNHGMSGSGHGLHLVGIVAQAHGGRCTAESSLGGGMRIELCLPIGQCGTETAEIAAMQPAETPDTLEIAEPTESYQASVAMDEMKKTG